jgi:hypothetical protein
MILTFERRKRRSVFTEDREAGRMENLYLCQTYGSVKKDAKQPMGEGSTSSVFIQ